MIELHLGYIIQFNTSTERKSSQLEKDKVDKLTPTQRTHSNHDIQIKYDQCPCLDEANKATSKSQHLNP